MPTTLTAGRTPRPVTGRTVLIYLVAFFGIVFTANFFLVRVALSSFSGVETDSAYKAGLTFKNNVAAAQAQDARHWAVDATLQRGDAARVTITAKDADGKPLSGLTPEFRLAHPTDKRHDVVVQAVETAPGQFQSGTPLPQGQWDLVIGFKRGEETVFLSRSRITL